MNLAANLTVQDRLDEAEACYQRAVDLAERHWPAGDPRTQRIGEMFAAFYRMLGLTEQEDAVRRRWETGGMKRGLLFSSCPQRPLRN